MFYVRSVGTFARALDCSSSVKQPSLHMSAAAASRDITQVFECTICTFFYSFVRYIILTLETLISVANSPSLRIIGSGAMLASTFKQSTLPQLTRKCVPFPRKFGMPIPSGSETLSQSPWLCAHLPISL